MNTIQQGIVTLLKSAVTGQKYSLPEGFTLEQAETYIRQHHMATLVYDGAVRCGLSRKDPVMQKLFGSYCRAMLKSEGQMQAVEKLFAAFSEAGIDYMPLKGCKMKPLYPKPELRTMGDADVLIRLEQYEKIVPILEALGFTHKIESDHELIWHSPQLYLELHKRLIPSYNKDYYAYFGDGWQRAVLQEAGRYGMTPEDEFIYLLTHFAKHFRDGGIGCRHVVDLWVYLRANPDLDGKRLETELTKLQLWEFYGNIRRLIDTWFAAAEPDAKTAWMTEFIFSSGSWGQAQTHLMSQMVRQSKSSALSFSGKLMYFWDNMFPKASAMEQNYPILKKSPWTLPLVWMHRLGYKALFEREAIARKRDTLQQITNEGVDERQQMLRFVGLDYHF